MSQNSDTSQRRQSAGKRKAGSVGPKKPINVSFWRLLNLLTGEPIEDIDWPSILGSLPGTHGFPGIDGVVSSWGDQYRVVLSRDRGTAPRQRYRLTGDKQPLVVRGADWDPIEEGFISFLPTHNVFAYSRTSISAPPPSAAAQWLTSLHIPDYDTTLKVDPLVDPDRFDRVAEGNPSALWVNIIARPPEALPAQGGFFQGLFSMRGIGEDIKIEIKVSTNRSEANLGTRQALFEEARHVQSDIEAVGGVVEQARVKIPGEPQPIDLISDQIVLTETTQLPLEARNRSITEQTIFDIHDRVIATHGQRISRCLGAL